MNKRTRILTEQEIAEIGDLVTKEISDITQDGDGHRLPTRDEIERFLEIVREKEGW